MITMTSDNCNIGNLFLTLELKGVPDHVSIPGLGKADSRSQVVGLLRDRSLAAVGCSKLPAGFGWGEERPTGNIDVHSVPDRSTAERITQAAVDFAKRIGCTVTEAQVCNPEEYELHYEMEIAKISGMAPEDLKRFYDKKDKKDEDSVIRKRAKAFVAKARRGLKGTWLIPRRVPPKR